jgi:hypothetical protein
VIAPLARLLRVDGAAHATLVRLFRTLYRRSGTNALRRGSDTRPAGTGWVWVAYAFYGLLASMTAMLGIDRFTFGTIVAGSALVLVGIAVVADFAALIVAPGDDDVLFHLPLESRTYLSARLAFAARHSAGIAIAYGIAPAIAAALRYGDPGWSAVFLATIVACGWLSLVLAFAVYRLALRWLGGERLRAVVAYLPGLLSLLLYVGPQLIPATRLPAAGAWRPLGEWLWAAPPAWFAAIPEVAFGSREPGVLLAAALGVLVLPVSAALLVRALGRGFLDDLRRLLSSSADAPRRRAPRRGLAPSPLVRVVFGLSTPEAQAGYLLYTSATRSREARARVLPMLLMPVVFALVALVSVNRGAMSAAAPYLVGVSAGTLWGLAAYHENPDASWLLASVPLSRYGQLVLGMASAIVVRQVLPIGAVVVALRVAAQPSTESLLGALHGLTGALLGLPIAVASRGHVPFTLNFRSREPGKGVTFALVSFLVASLAFGLERVLAGISPWALAVTPFAFAATVLVWLRAVAVDLDRAPPDDLFPAQPAAA